MKEQRISGPSNTLIEMKDLKFLWKMVYKNLFVILLSPVVFYAIGHIYAYRLNDIYGAKAQLLLKSQETYDYQDPIYQGLGAYGAYMDVANQIRILQSRDLIAEVVDKIDANTSYYVTGRLKKKEVFGTLPFNAEVEVFNPNNLYENPLKIEIVDLENYNCYYSTGGEDHSIKGQFGEAVATKDFNLTLNENYLFTDDNLDRITSSNYEVIFHSDAYMISHFQSRMTIENLEYTSILQLNLKDDIGVRAKVFLDTLSAVFIDYSQRSQIEINENTLGNIEKQINEVQKILVNIENELLKYKKDNDIIELTKEEDIYFSKYVEYTEDERELNYKLSSVKLLENYIQTSEDERLLPPSFYIMEGDVYLQLKVQEFYALQLSKSDKIYSVSENHPSMIKLRKDLVEMRKDILTYLKNLKIALSVQIDENKKLIQKYKNNVQGIPRSLQGVENIRRELEVNNKMYLFLLEKKTNTLIAKAGIIPQVQIVEKSQSLGVIGPEKAKIKNLFLLAGIVFGFLIALTRKIFFEKIENAEELSDVTSLAVVAGIPFLKNIADPLVVNSSPKSHVTECFRTFRSNISFMGKNQGSDKATTILISSYFPGEGKTFCSSNLACILARSEKKVLLIDFDLHKPKIHKSFGLENLKGISNVLVGKMNIEDVKHVNVIEDLDIVTCGTIPPNPSELVLKAKVKELIEKAQNDYDYVILDTPPFGLLNDSIELGKHADIMIGVLNTKYAKRRGVKVIEEILSKNEDLSVGLVINGITESKIRYYYSKYSYKYSYASGYGYGYGYGYGSDYGTDEIDEGGK